MAGDNTCYVDNTDLLLNVQSKGGKQNVWKEENSNDTDN